MEDSRLFRYGLMTAEAVAQEGWKGFSRGKRVIIPGWKNKLLATLGHLTPHVISLRVIRRLHERA
jgi:short-subunit dehydrogenase